ncbi:MAG: Mrp/NBP35 family ATP-binding protein [Thermoguttaceae bacterium]|nr:Mrp/NBP35 family ATP-binding protein [Thermoguttaceae bacterium]MDW8079882.1 Mrp/NBP35 family ATP-binding protein [Thermoguttaceae bacterium]
MDSLSTQEINRLLDEFADPETGRGLVREGQVRAITVHDRSLQVEVGFSRLVAPLWADLARRLEGHLSSRLGNQWTIRVNVAEHPRPAQKLEPIGLAAKAVVAIGSGKGGVGKSTVTVLLAYGLRRAGAHVAILDADVFGPSIPHLLGASDRPTVVDNKIIPVLVNDVPILSMGLLVPEREAVIWRGPMVHNVLMQFLRDTNWGELDYLLVDMPPGTGDVAISLSQLVPLTGAVVVCTPQDLALLDAVKAVTMFRRVNVEVLGMVENMSYFICPGCGSRHEIFGHGGARSKATELGIPFLGEIPLHVDIRVRGDSGQVLACLDDPRVSPAIENLTKRLVEEVINERRRRPVLRQLTVIH